MNTLLDPPNTRPLQHRADPLEDTGYGSGFRNDDTLNDEPPARELTLGTATILGLFFALALVCAVFFGFGYSLGSRHSAAVVSASAAPAPIVTTAKPSPGSGTISPNLDPPLPTEAVTVIPARVVTAKPTASESAPPPARPAEPTPDPRPLPAAANLPIVQVAAVSHQEDAELIASTLKRHGYPVVIRSEPQDKLLHLQLGPFPTKKDAEAMRQRLIADGFNAYIK